MRLIIILTLLLTLNACNTAQRECADFRTGTFEFEEFLNGEVQKTTFIRNDTMEVDYFNKKVDSFAVRWINDCEYVVRSLRPKSLAEERAVHFKILSTEGNRYTFEYSMVIKKNKSSKRFVKKGTATKISD
ncbi:MAG: DNA topoisomerase IV [Gilvibacter sp.]